MACRWCYSSSFLLISLLLTHVTVQSTEPIQYEIAEERDPGTHIGNIQFDSDLTSQYSETQLATITYHLIPNQKQRYFFLDSVTGEFQTADILDRDQRDVCRSQAECVIAMQVAARGPSIFKLIKVHVTVLDMNDNPPKFEQPRLLSSLLESTGPGVLFPVIPAQDPDSPLFGVKRYELVADTAIFHLQVTNTDSGSVDLQLVLDDGLDREAEDYYQVKVVAYDGGSPAKSGSVTIDLTILDENDNTPTFDQSTYDVRVPENLPVGAPESTLIQLRAADPDLGPNGQVTYSFDSKTQTFYGSTFGINAVTGEIFLKTRLDYKQMSLYSLGVAAQDEGPSSFPSHAKVFIHVEDVNDHKPTITVDPNTQSGQVEVLEHANSDTFVAHISVTDQDDNENGEVECWLQDESNNFQVQHIVDTEFKILTTRKLDREVQDTYDMTFLCHDEGSPSLSSSAEIVVSILDINDHRPVFSQSHYSATVEENNRAGEVIIQVTATDDDIGKNAEMRYSLTAESDSLLDIDPKSGVITAQASFDREHIHQMEVTVVATDQGQVAQSSTVLLELHITDLNDEPPIFTEQRFSFSIAENTAPKSKVGSVLATDADLPGNNELSYSLDEDFNSLGVFSINPITGTLFTEAQLDRETNDVYELIVLAQSDSVPHRSASAVVIIHIVDVNDNAPTITFPRSGDNNTFVISTQVPVGYRILTVQAEDKDDGINSEVTYGITEGNEYGHFIMEPSKGELLVNTDLSGEDGNTFPVIVTVRDNGASKQHTAVTTLTVVVDQNVLYPDPAYSSESTRGLSLSSKHLAVVICVIVGSFLVAMFLVVAILLVRRRGKQSNKNSSSTQHTLYLSKPASDVIPNTGAGHSTDVYDAENVPYTEHSSSKSQADHLIGQEKDTDSGCADISHTESQASSEETDQRLSRGLNSQGPTVTLKCYHPKTHPQSAPVQQQQQQQQQLPDPPSHQPPPPPPPPQPPRRHDSFSDWLQNESYQLQKKGNMYRVNEPNAKKSVRFTEPETATATVGKAENDYSVDPTVVKPVVTSPSQFYANIAHYNTPFSGNVGRTSTFESPAHTSTGAGQQELSHSNNGSLV